MSFDIFARGSSHIAWKQLMVMCRFLENSEVGNIGRVIIMFIHYQHNILVGITGGDMLNLTDHGSTAKGTHMGKTTTKDKGSFAFLILFYQLLPSILVDETLGHVGLLLPYPLTSRPYSSIVAPNYV
ncbi:hypothetical protein ACJX0J_021303, partial [Zea mays]